MIIRELVNLIGFQVDEGSLRNVEQRADALMGTIGKLAEATGLFTLGHKITEGMSTALEKFADMNQALAMTGITLRDNAELAGMTSESMLRLAETITEGTTYDDGEFLKDGLARLMMFKGVTKDVFQSAAALLPDLATRLETSTGGAAVRLGRMLEQPGEGLDVLSRQGIRFTDVQKQMIKGMVAAGRTAEAQNYILQSLENRGIKGAARAMADASTQAYKIHKAIEKLKESFGQYLLPIAQKVNTAISEMVKWFEALSPATKKTILVIAGLTAALAFALATTIALDTALGVALVAGLGAVAPFIPAILAIGAALFLIIDDFMAWQEGGKSVLGDLLGNFQIFAAQVMAFMEPLIAALTAIWDGFMVAVKGVLDVIVGLFTGNGDKILEGIGGILYGLYQMLMGACDFIGVLVLELMVGLSALIVKGLEGLRDLVWNIVKSLMTLIIGFIRQSIIEFLKMLAMIPGVGGLLNGTIESLNKVDDGKVLTGIKNGAANMGSAFMGGMNGAASLDPNMAASALSPSAVGAGTGSSAALTQQASQNNNVVVNQQLPPGTPESHAALVRIATADAINEALAQQNRKVALLYPAVQP